MRRTITDQLIDWNTSSRRQPLLLRGARQVGKTWAVTDFAQRHMPGRLHLVDFERDVEWRRFFEGNLDIDRILGALELAMGRSIAVGQDLLFLDEIQACPRAVVALRRARVIHRISAARIAGMPLGAMVSARTRKAILVDMGLMHALTDMSIEAGLRQPDLLGVCLLYTSPSPRD